MENIRKYIIVVSLSLALLAGGALAANAETITLSDFEGRDAWATIDINDSDPYKITLRATLYKTDGDMYGVFMDFNELFNSSEPDGFQVTAYDMIGSTYLSLGTTLKWVWDNDNVYKLKSGPNMEGAVKDTGFDLGIQIGGSGGLSYNPKGPAKSQPDAFTDVLITLTADDPLALGDRYGIRIQSLNGNDSAKLLGYTSTAAVPEPATMLLFGSALGGAAFFRRRRARKLAKSQEESAA